MPVRVQLELRLTPEPLRLPAVMAQVTVPVPPLCDRDCEYGLPCVAFGKLDVVIEGAELIVTVKPCTAVS